MKPRTGDLVVGKWGARYLGQVLPCSVGRGGIGEKLGEGDGVTPLGRFQIGALLYRPDRLAPLDCDVDTHPIGPRDVWSDDPKDYQYNDKITAWRHPFSHEALRRADPLYDLIAVLDYNWPDAIPGKGSAIFMHIWRKPRHPTEGCVAFAQRDFLWILSTWRTTSRVIIQP